MKILLLSICIVLLSSCGANNVKNLGNTTSPEYVFIPVGSKVIVELEVKNNRIVGYREVPSVKDPSISVIFEFTKMENGRLLAVTNPLKSPIKYHINMVANSGKMYPTSSCPAFGGAYENWNDTIPKLAISDFKILSEGTTVGCVY